MNDLTRLVLPAIKRLEGKSGDALIGFDGFVDLIYDAVDRRTGAGERDYVRLTSAEEFKARCGSTGKSANIELVLRESRWGGNGPLAAGALAALGARATFIGAVGGEGPGGVHPAYGPLSACAAAVHPIAPPGLTHAIEFDDGKLMLNVCGPLQGVTWERVRARVGDGALRGLLAGCGLLMLTNWSLHQTCEEIWRGLMGMMRASESRPIVVLDISDPAKRSDEDVQGLGELLREFTVLTDTTLCLNDAESARLARVVSGEQLAPGAPDKGRAGDDAAAVLARIARRATLISAGLGVTVAVHTRVGAAVSSCGGGALTVRGALVPRPLISTGAGDHFASGFAFARLHGENPESALALASACASAYVAGGRAPSLSEIHNFVAGNG